MTGGGSQSDQRSFDQRRRALRPWTVVAVLSFLLAAFGMIAQGFLSTGGDGALVVALWVVDGLFWLIGLGMAGYVASREQSIQQEEAHAEAAQRAQQLQQAMDEQMRAAGVQMQNAYAYAMTPPQGAWKQQLQEMQAAMEHAEATKLSRKLQQLEYAHASGLLTDEEFKRQRAALLLPDDFRTVALKCSSCGAQLQPQAGQTTMVCGYCGSHNQMVRS